MLVLTILLVVSSEGLRGVLQDTFAYLASYPSLFLLFLLFGFGVAVASSYIHFHLAKRGNASSTTPLTCYDCEQQHKTKSSPKSNKKAKRQADNVGILAMEVYFPANYIDQSDLEQYDGVGAGKYTKGLGQDKMSFTGDREDNEHAGVTKNGHFFDVAANDFVLFHSPYNKLAQKGFSRIVFNDFLRNPTLPQYDKLRKWHGAALEDTYYDRDLDAASREVSLALWNKMVEPSCFASRHIGNCYTASVYINLACLVDSARATLHGKRLMLFSYGSGAVGSIFSFRCVRPEATDVAVPAFTVERMSDCLNLASRLNSRLKRTPEEFNGHLDLRQASHGLKSYTPVQSVDSLFPGTYYLVGVDDKHRRKYARKPLNAPLTYVALPSAAVATATTVATHPITAVATSPVAAIKPALVEVLVTGVAAGAPGIVGADLTSLLEGVNCIQRIPDAAKHAMVAKRVVQLKKDGASGAIRRLPVTTINQTIQLAAPMAVVDLVKDFGLPKSLVEGMDDASACAVAAGLRALQQAGLVAGTVENGWGNWRLPDAMAASTGVLFAAQLSNSAFHGASLDKEHMAQELNRFLQAVESEHGIPRAALAAEGVYYSHETCTQASPTTSCSFTELYMLRSAFGDAGLDTLVLANTKAFTGHAMGVSFEEVIAVEGLKRGLLPPVVNFASHDEHLSPRPLRLSQGGAYPHVKYALRFAAGFGSQIAFTLYMRK
ncbi:hypothetical protein DYB35_008372 [Aphanomyces astaci]|uniref:Hydroxymethylglutaryl-coenzyme A synthase C-terminal domain-containing protein n=1 Tax=Aphanomyces astaci TaxID=112090 RepID=A0A3R6XQJ7_APHAT|nr:hypothetical protein DYB35_008372 [Aphanomyces astaci]